MTVRAAAWLLLGLVALDLGNPSLCALDQEMPSIPVSAAATLDAGSTDGGAPIRPVHVDDCFCCSHCVDVASAQSPAKLAWASIRIQLPTDSAPLPTAYPPYHPPRA